MNAAILNSNGTQLALVTEPPRVAMLKKLRVGDRVKVTVEGVTNEYEVIATAYLGSMSVAYSGEQQIHHRRSERLTLTVTPVRRIKRGRR